MCSDRAAHSTVRSRVVLGIVGGALCAFGLSLFLGWGFFLFLLHHMVIAGTRVLYLVFGLPLLFMLAGGFFAIRALRN